MPLKINPDGTSTWAPDGAPESGPQSMYSGMQSFNQAAPNPYGQAPEGGDFGGSTLDILGSLSGQRNANGSGFGLNLPTISAGISAFGQLGGLYLGLKQLGLAKDSFKLQKEAYRTNLANSTRSYNTQVADRVAGRNYGSEEERMAALKAAQLPTTGY